MDASERHKRVAAEAAEWWVVLQGDVSRAQREQYVDWLRESAVHVSEMLRVAQVHGALDQFDRWARIPTDGSGDREGQVVTFPTSERPAGAAAIPHKHTPRRLRPGLRLAFAAPLLIAAGLGAFLLITPRAQIIQTDRGERRSVALEDGSVVQVDPETRLRVEYQAHWRRVVLEQGRALFHVAKNSSQPFFVRVLDTTVRAVGTAFAVERDPRSITVTVAEGKVAIFLAHPSPPVIESGPPEGRPGWAPGRPDAAVTHRRESQRDNRKAARSGSAALGTDGEQVAQIFLTADEQVTVDSSGTAEPVREVDSGRALAWADGRLVFENEPVDSIVRQFNRYNRIQLYVGDGELAHRPISGVFNAADPESFVAFLQSVAAVRITRNDAADITIDAAK